MSTTIWDYVGFHNIIPREQTYAEIRASNQLWGAGLALHLRNCWTESRNQSSGMSQYRVNF